MVLILLRWASVLVAFVLLVSKLVWDIHSSVPLLSALMPLMALVVILLLTVVVPVLVVAKLVRLPGEILDRHIGPLASEQRDWSSHGVPLHSPRLKIGSATLQANGGIGSTPPAGHSPSGRREYIGRERPGEASQLRTTRRSSQMPHTVTSRLPIQTAIGGSSPAFTRSMPNISSG